MSEAAHIPSATVDQRRSGLRLSRQVAVLVLTALLLGCGLLASARWGSVAISWAELGRVIRGQAAGTAAEAIFDLRLSRSLLAGLVGMNLGLAGALLQGIMRNPLAAPNIIGVTAGAGLAATAVIVLTSGLPLFLPPAAFAGAMATAVVVYLISWQPGAGTSPMRMVLAGVAISAMLGAVTSFLMVVFNDRVGQVVMWMSGNLAARGWNHVQMVWPYTLVGLAGAVLLARPLDLLQLGEQSARGLGVPVEWTRVLAMAAAALLVASAVSVAGLIGFIGLMVPHMMRMLGGHRHGYVVIASALGGALLLVWADLAARLMLAPMELPVGILTAVLGGPYFVFLLYRRKLIG